MAPTDWTNAQQHSLDDLGMIVEVSQDGRELRVIAEDGAWVLIDGLDPHTTSINSARHIALTIAKMRDAGIEEGKTLRSAEIRKLIGAFGLRG